MKKKVLLIVAIIIYTNSFAQISSTTFKKVKTPQKNKLTTEQKALLQAQKLALLLDLTEEQQQTVLEINKDFFKQLKEHKESSANSRNTFENMYFKNKILLNKQRAMQEVLSTEQYKHYKKLKLKHVFKKRRAHLTRR